MIDINEIKILIVGTVPYDKNSTSRAFESYFSDWKKENLAQIFSNPSDPIKGHCENLYQITDARMLKRWFVGSITTGVNYKYNELSETKLQVKKKKKNIIIENLYRIGSHKNSMNYLLRKLLWRKKYWYTKELEQWLSIFNPNCIFLSFSDDFFILEIALNISKKYRIPIISSIGDDYFFNNEYIISPLYYIYKHKYKNLVRKIFINNKHAIYIGDKIKNKYNEEFELSGETIYLTSEIKPREFSIIRIKEPVISYFGNIRLGRNESLNDIANALRKINPNYILNVYSNEKESRYFKIFDDNPNVYYHGAIDYSDVKDKILKSDVLIVVEGFKRKDINITKYSLSTKVADSIASGVPVFAYGSYECGAIEYCKNSKAIQTCICKNDLVNNLSELIYDVSKQKIYYDEAMKLVEKNHNIMKSTKVFRRIVAKAIEEGQNC